MTSRQNSKISPNLTSTPHGPYSGSLYQITDFEARLSAGGGTRRRRNGVLAVVFTFYDSSPEPVQTTFVENVSNSLPMAQLSVEVTKPPNPSEPAVGPMELGRPKSIQIGVFLLSEGTVVGVIAPEHSCLLR